MTEDQLLEVLKSVWSRETSADQAMEQLLSLGEKRYARDVTNKVFTVGVTLNVDCSYGAEYTTRV
jgi:hypothetical protein